MLSHSEEQKKRLALRHLIWPDKVGFISEALIGIIVLFILNLTVVGSRYISDSDEFFTFNLQILNDFLDKVQQYSFVQQAYLFLMWALVGGLLYVLVFHLIRIIFGVHSSVGKGVKYVRQDHTYGIIRWLTSLHDFFIRALVAVAGVGALLFGLFVCLGISSQELNDGLASSFPVNIGQLFLSFIAVLISMRLIVIGICLLSQNFRNWYLN